MAYTTPSTVSGSDVLTAALWNTQIRDNFSALQPLTQQGHQVLTTAQKNALTGVTTGTMVYDSTLGLLQIRTSAGWVAAGGYFPIIPASYSLNNVVQSVPTSPTISWSGTRIVSLDGVFNGNLQFYKVTLFVTAASGPATVRFQPRNAGGDLASSTLNSSSMNVRDATVSAPGTPWGSFPSQVSPTIFWNILPIYSTFPTNSFAQFELINPGTASPTFATSMAFYRSSATAGDTWHERRLATDTSSNAWTGFTIDPGSGNTWSGSVIVHGMA